MYKYPITSNEIFHYGIKRRSGRYPWGSGENPYQGEGGYTGKPTKYDYKRSQQWQTMSTDEKRKKYKQHNKNYSRYGSKKLANKYEYLTLEKGMDPKEADKQIIKEAIRNQVVAQLVLNPVTIMFALGLLSNAKARIQLNNYAVDGMAYQQGLKTYNSYIPKIILVKELIRGGKVGEIVRNL